MYSGVKAYGGPHEVSGIAVSLYFVLLVILGNCILESKRDFNFEKLIFSLWISLFRRILWELRVSRSNIQNGFPGHHVSLTVNRHVVKCFLGYRRRQLSKRTNLDRGRRKRETWKRTRSSSQQKKVPTQQQGLGKGWEQTAYDHGHQSNGTQEEWKCSNFNWGRKQVNSEWWARERENERLPEPKIYQTDEPTNQRTLIDTLTTDESTNWPLCELWDRKIYGLADLRKEESVNWRTMEPINQRSKEWMNFKAFFRCNHVPDSTVSVVLLTLVTKLKT